MRVAVFSRAQTPACIAGASQHDVGKALRFSKGVAALQQAHHGGGVEVLAAVNIAVLTGHHIGQLAAVGRHAQALAQRFEQARAALLMPDVAGQQLGRGGAFAQVMGQAGQAHRQRRVQAGAHVEHQHQVHAGVDLGVVVGALRHTPQAVYLGEQPR